MTSRSSRRPSPECRFSRPRSKMSVVPPIQTEASRRPGAAIARRPSVPLQLADFGFFAPGEPLAAALHGRDELGEVHLERVEDVVRVVLRAEPDFTLARPCFFDDLLGLALGLPDDLLLGDQAGLLLACLADDPLSLTLRLGEHLLAFLDDPARLLDLLRDRRAHLIEDVVDLLFVDTHGVREGHLLGVVNCVVEFVDEDEDVHGHLNFVSAEALPSGAQPPEPEQAGSDRRRTWPVPSLRRSSRS